eukprot:scaffold39395_cov40-Prasinocladus_malaysianus.AAC.1
MNSTSSTSTRREESRLELERVVLKYGSANIKVLELVPYRRMGGFSKPGGRVLDAMMVPSSDFRLPTCRSKLQTLKTGADARWSKKAPTNNPRGDSPAIWYGYSYSKIRHYGARQGSEQVRTSTRLVHVAVSPAVMPLAGRMQPAGQPNLRTNA